MKNIIFCQIYFLFCGLQDSKIDKIYINHWFALKLLYYTDTTICSENICVIHVKIIKEFYSKKKNGRNYWIKIVWLIFYFKMSCNLQLKIYFFVKSNFSRFSMAYKTHKFIQADKLLSSQPVYPSPLIGWMSQDPPEWESCDGVSLIYQTLTFRETPHWSPDIEHHLSVVFVVFSDIFGFKRGK